MVARWDYREPTGWSRTRVMDHVWQPIEDAARIGAERARLTALAEALEERADDLRLASEGEALLATEALAERRTLGRDSRRLAEELARDGR